MPEPLQTQGHTPDVYGSYLLNRQYFEELRAILDKIKTTDKDTFIKHFSAEGREIIKRKPNMAALRKNITSVVYYVKRQLKTTQSVAEMVPQIGRKIDDLLDRADDIRRRIGDSGSKLILNNQKILTISYSSHVKEIFLLAHRLKRRFTVYCLESRPALEGHRFAAELAKTGIRAVIITDAAMAHFAGDANMVIVGADRIFESGFLNKTGTLPLAYTAAKMQIPFYIACETNKILKEIDFSVRFYSDDPEQVHKIAKNGPGVKNIVYESIPLDLVSKIVTEEGIFDTKEFSSWYLEE